MGLYKVKKQGSDENTRGLPYYRKIGVKKNIKTTLNLLLGYVTDVE